MSLGLAILAGVAAVAAFPVDHLSTATFVWGDATDAATRDAMKADLLLAAASVLGHPSPGGAEEPSEQADEKPWHISQPAPTRLTIGVVMRDPDSGPEYLLRVIERFEHSLQARRDAIRNTPGPAERALSEMIARLTRRKHELAEERAAAEAMLPATNENANTDELTDKWQSLRTDFQVLRHHLDLATETEARIRQRPVPDRGIVSTERRAAAFQRDRALQQDLAELHVEMAAVKLQLIGARDRTLGKLEESGLQARHLQAIAAPDSERVFDEHSRSAVTAVREHADAYLRLHTAFAEDMVGEFAAAAQLIIDPLSGALLDAHARLRRRAHDFLFQSNKELGHIRSILQDLGNDTANHARYHVLESELTRAFQRLQWEHDELEFALGELEPARNFRLDGALERARGLFRRAQTRIAAIDETLQAETAEILRRERARQLAQAKESARQLRETVDKRVASLIQVQNALNLAHSETQSVLRAVLLRDMTTTQLTATRLDLADATARLERFQADRLARAEALQPPRPTRSTTIPTEARIEQAAVGGLAAMLTFFAIGIGQWWMRRLIFAAEGNADRHNRGR
ncbi:MAG: hypothetical protein ACE5E5_15475 [Phycisphaerae bacterium]